MTDLVKALGWETGWRGSAHVLALLAGATLGLLLAGFVASALVGASPVLVQAAIWAGWLLWLGAVFPRNATWDASHPCAFPYRRAFTREILLGVGVAFSQILRPALIGVAEAGAATTSLAYLLAGGALVLGGFATIALGVSALGVARTLFVFEYVRGQRSILNAGIYRFLRHPLFLGGTTTSLGLAVCTADRTAIALGLLNACVVPFYVWLEDRRCCTILGPDYGAYRASVGGMVPRRRAAISASASRRQPSGRAGPITERSRVSRR
ncbi:MAG TPA: methyltransferase [Solirubrobacterales bacterium]|nr:methyltransferase [Solirubrobacterales bacterium]